MNSNWRELADVIKGLLTDKQFEQAKIRVVDGLQKFENEHELLQLASDTFRGLMEREQSLSFARRFIASQPDHWNGYARAAEDLAALDRHAEAKEIINAGLRKHPTQINLLAIASDIHRALAEPEQALIHAECLISHYPQPWIGYGRAAKSLIALQRPEEAKARLREGLARAPEQRGLQQLQRYLEQSEILLRTYPSLVARLETSIEAARQATANATTANDPGQGHSRRCAVLIRCQEVGEREMALHIHLQGCFEHEDIYFAVDSLSAPEHLQTISVRRFKQTTGLDWAIDRAGWKFGDFCFYACREAGLDYEHYLLLENDLYFHGNSLRLLADSIQHCDSDLVASKFGLRDYDWAWTRKMEEAYPDIGNIYGCMFGVIRLSKRAIGHLYRQRMAAFHEYACRGVVDKLNNHFPNDESFVCTILAHSAGFTCDPINPGFLDTAYGFNSILHPAGFQSDSILHRYVFSEHEFISSLQRFLSVPNTAKRRARLPQNLIDAIEINIGNRSALRLIVQVVHQLETITPAHREFFLSLLQVLEPFTSTGEFEHTFRQIKPSRSCTISQIKGLTVEAKATRIARSSDFDIEAPLPINSRILPYLGLPFCLEDNVLYSTLSNPGIIDRPFLYMAQREQASFLIQQSFDNLTIDNIDQEQLIFVFSMGRCGSTLISNLLRHCGVKSVAECDAFMKADNDEAILKIISQFTSLAPYEGSTIAFKFRGATCRHIELYLRLFPRAHFLFAYRSPATWAKSNSAKFRWNAMRMHANYLAAHHCMAQIRAAHVSKAFLYYDNVKIWPALLYQQPFVSPSINRTSLMDALLHELSIDSQHGYIDRGPEGYADTDVKEFLAMELPAFS